MICIVINQGEIDKAMLFFIYILFGTVKYSRTFITPLHDEPVCPAAICKNNGTLDLQTCACDCPPPYSGYFCETEMKQTSWPHGCYALHTSMFGCPEHEHYGWSEGYVNMTLKANSRNMVWNDEDLYSFEPHILGPYSEQNIQMNFCLINNTQHDDSSEIHRWPKGNYCIYKHGKDCPEGFKKGNMTMFGYNYVIGGDLPHIGADNPSYLTLWYCCRDDGDVSIPINLPKTFPFLLFKGPSAVRCQEVDDMEMSMDMFYVTNENLDFEFNGVHPNFSRHATHHNYIGLPLCYYHPTFRQECIYKTDNGSSYDGRVNVTQSGKKCFLWSEVDDVTTNTQWVGEFELNYCRRMFYWNDTMCFYNDSNNMYYYEDCRISFCDEDSNYLEILGAGLSYNSAPAKDSFFSSRAVDGLIGTGISYISERPYVKPWFLLDLHEFVEVHAIVIHRHNIWFPINHRYLGTYVSKNRWDFLTYGAYRCENNRNPRRNPIFRYQCKRPIVGQYTSVKNFDMTDPGKGLGRFHYFEIDEIQVIGKRTMCGRRLGLVTGEVYDFQLESSSNENSKVLASHGRLFYPGGWCARQDDVNPWFLVCNLINGYSFTNKSIFMCQLLVTFVLFYLFTACWYL